jgi:hypothetical protein
VAIDTDILVQAVELDVGKVYFTPACSLGERIEHTQRSAAGWQTDGGIGFPFDRFRHNIRGFDTHGVRVRDDVEPQGI